MRHLRHERGIRREGRERHELRQRTEPLQQVYDETGLAWWKVMVNESNEPQPDSIETGVVDKKGGMGGTVKALENALGDQDGVHILIEDHPATGETQIHVSTARATTANAAPVPNAVDKQLREWGYSTEGEFGNPGHYVYQKD